MEVLLTIAILTAGKPPVIYREPMPTVEICMEEAKQFLSMEWPGDADEMHADCSKTNPHEQKS